MFLCVVSVTRRLKDGVWFKFCQYLENCVNQLRYEFNKEINKNVIENSSLQKMVRKIRRLLGMSQHM